MRSGFGALPFGRVGEQVLPPGTTTGFMPAISSLYTIWLFTEGAWRTGMFVIGRFG